MTFWINQHLIETKELINQWRTNRNVSVVATVDHVEIASGHIVLGLNVGWENKTPNPITVMEIQVVVYKRSEDDVLLRLLPLERFGRNDIQRSLIKTPLSQFNLPPKKIHSEYIRFLAHQSLDLPSGIYEIDIQIRDTNHTSYTRRTKIEIQNKMKYRLTEDWNEISEKKNGLD